MKKKLVIFALLFVMIIAGILRLYRLNELGTFLADQAIETAGAEQILSGNLTLVGIKTSNSEVRNGAIMYYLLAPLLRIFNFDPIAGGILQTILSLGAILITFLISPIASFLIAISALLVNYSRQTMLAYYPLFFSALAFYLSLKITQKLSFKLSLLLGVLLGSMLQIHYLTLAVIIFAIGLPLFSRIPKIKYYLGLLLGFLIGFLPMMAFELRHDFFNTKMLLSYLSSPGRVVNSVNLFTYWQEVVSIFLFGSNILLGTIALFALGFFYFRRKLTIVEKLSWWQIFTTFLITCLFRNELFPPLINIAHYALPAFIPLAILFANIFRRKIILFLLVITIFIINFSSYGLSNNHGYTMSPGWNLPGLKKAAKTIKEDVGWRKYNVTMIIDAQNQGIPLRYFLNSFSNPPLSVDNYSGADFLYIITRPGITPEEVHIWEVDSFRPFIIDKTWEIQNGYVLYRLAKEGGLKTTHNFLTLVYPVRGRNLWTDRDLTQLNSFLKVISEKEFPATFLFQYDALVDKEAVNKLSINNSEPGLFMEVSENLATDALVPFKIGEGHWSRPDKTFLSGYSLFERQRMIDLTMKTFKAKFGHFPKTVGAWYLDPFSLNYLVNRYQVTGYISVADQFDTDAQRYWGKPWGTPFYPQKYDSLAAASNLKNKLNIVEIEWAQRHPTDGFCAGVSCSQNSFQANDYINNKKNTDYFRELLNIYLNSNNPFNQITIGVEVGQELYAFEKEHLTQLEILSALSSSGKLKFLTVSEFSSWYQKTYPNLSPVTVVSDGVTAWVNTPCFRKAVRDGKIIDFRRYDQVFLSPDLFKRDGSIFLSREIPLSQNLTEACQFPPDQSLTVRLKTNIGKTIEDLQNKLSFFRYSTLEGKKIVGIQTSPTNLVGFWQGKDFGEFEFPFQILVRFKSLKPSN